MGLLSNIEWTDATWNPWQGCTKVSEACDNCYMFSDLKRYGRDGSIVVRSKPPTFRLPLKRKRTGEYAIPPGLRVFTCSWSDFFHEKADRWRAEAWDIIRARTDVTFQIVTKRTKRIAKHLPPDWGDGWPHVWLIATAENQRWLDVRILDLLRVPAAVRGLSLEPLLGPVDVLSSREHYDAHEGLPACGFWHHPSCPSYCDFACGGVEYMGKGIDWVIAGGESGHHARPMHPDWARVIRDQCQAAGVPFFFKQWGEWRPFSGDDRGRQIHRFDDEAGTWMAHVGKATAGRLLDGREWSEFPAAEVLA